MTDFVIITPLEEEREAMLAHLGKPNRLPPANDDIRVYYPATIPVTFTNETTNEETTSEYEVVLTDLLGMGRVEAANAVGDAIRRWRPRYVILAGIAGGLSKAGVQVGDVLISEQIADYELQKLTEETTLTRWSVHRASPALLAAAKQLRPEDWQRFVREPRPQAGKPQRHFGPICTGDKVVANGLLDQYHEVWTKLIGCEMEAGGVASAAFEAASAPGFLMVRGVSDLADPDKDKAQIESWRAYACDVAAAYVEAFFKSGPVVPISPVKLIVVPREFEEAVEKVQNDEANGHATLALLGEEAKRNAWAREGVRLVGRAQRRMKSFKAALESWEFIRKDLPDDVEANLQLATIFQRLGDIVSASQACRRVLANASAERKDRADARSQLARNEKASWLAGFRTLASEAARREQAISDNRLIEAFDGYMAGFAEDLNDYYSGINALGLLTAIVKLAETEPDAWAGRFEMKKKAEAALDDFREQLDYVRGAVRMSLENARRQSERSGKPDEWLPPSEAQYRLLTADNPVVVKNAYRAAKNAGGSGFSVDSEAAQVGIFHLLGLLPENCRAALESLGIPSSPSEFKAVNPLKSMPPRDLVIVATGHRADAPDRASPRFPNTPECIAKAKSWLREKVEAERAETKGLISGMGGAASGTDLLFHEVCAELGIPTTVVLPIPKEDYCRQSVADGGPDWVEGFNRLVGAKPPIILSDSADLPAWAESIPNYSVFQRGNIWMMEDALLRPSANVTLLALWNGKAGDGPGGTADMVGLAKAHGAKVCTKNTDELFGLSR
ncbi:MAG TPA: tetratricopeptide repeat-containing protein [Casimicrobiaceae bacterium]|nr:tetratricopeptide repeat-containing protein [Casimicrobiaceae bacterium]